MHHKTQRRAAFTLVELSIVLIVVGLVVGAVLVGQDLRKAAEIRGFLNTLNKFNVASSTFRLKYRNLPGDVRASDATTYGLQARAGTAGHGDGNGIIEACAAGGIILGCETALFWRDLTDAQLTSAGFTAATDSVVDGTAGGFRIGDYLPIAPFRDNIYYFVYPRDSRNTYYISRISAIDATGTATMTGGLTPREARAIDEKLDDAAPQQGVVQAMTSPLVIDLGAAPGPTVCVNNTIPTNVTYNSADVYSEAVTCQISIRNSL